ncbi:MAG TPA: Ig-like domain-containing protein, partial [Vicinamibacteria bacterium]
MTTRGVPGRALVAVPAFLALLIAAPHVARTTRAEAVPGGTLWLSPDGALSDADAAESGGRAAFSVSRPVRGKAAGPLLRFDLSALPADAVIQDATLYLTLVETDGAAEDGYAVAARKVVGRKPAVAAREDGAVHAALGEPELSPAYDVRDVDHEPGVKAWSLTRMAQEWHADPAGNLGVLLEGDASLPADRRRAFAGATAPEDGTRPLLRVTYAQPPLRMTVRPEDTYLNLDAKNYGRAAVLGTYTWRAARPANVILMKFDLSALPAGAVVQSAAVQAMLVGSDAGPETTYKVSVHKVVGKSPVLASATGYTTDGVEPWTANACCENGVPLAQADISAAHDVRAVDKRRAYKVWTVTRMVKEWIADPASNFGLLLNADTSKPSDRWRYFASMEDPDPARRPFLRVLYTLPAGDAAAPVISISAPAAGASVGGTVAVTAQASDDLGVAGVQFQVDGANLGTEDVTAPWAISWNTTGLANGAHGLTAVARDAAGNRTTSPVVPVTVANDRTSPAVSVTAPSAGAEVSGMITVTAAASDDVGVAGVQFKLDGANLGPEDATAPYAVAWDTAAAATGAHTLTATARDAAGNRTTSAGVGVT